MSIDWDKLVTHPLGMASFSLFILFQYLAVVKRKDERRWLTPTAVTAAFVVLVGGLALAFYETPASEGIRIPLEPKLANQSQQTVGPQSPAIIGNGNSVTYMREPPSPSSPKK